MTGGTGIPTPFLDGDLPPEVRDAAGRTAMTVDQAMARAVRQVRPHVIVACRDPAGRFGAGPRGGADDRAGGPVFVEAADDREALAIALGAAAGGCRVFAAIGGQRPGWATDICHHAGALRLGMVVGLLARGETGSESAGVLSFRDAPCVQLQAEDAQEAYDLVLGAFRVAGDFDLRLPVIVGVPADGGGVLRSVATLSDEQAALFAGEFAAPEDLLDVEHPHGLSMAVDGGAAHALRGQIGAAMRLAAERIERLGREYEALTGRPGGMMVCREMDDARIAVVATGPLCRPARSAVQALRREGLAAGLVKLRVLRPFPWRQLADVLLRPGLGAVCVPDAAVEPGSGGPLFQETAAALAAGAAGRGGDLPRLRSLIIGGASEAAACTELRSVLVELSARSQAGPQPDPVRFAGWGPIRAGLSEQVEAARGAGQPGEGAS